MTALAPGASPSTLMPNTICDVGVSLICIRASWLGSLDNRSSRRPSSGCVLCADEKLIMNFGPGAAVNRNTITAARSTYRKDTMRTIQLAQGLVDVPKNIVKVLQP